MEKLLTFLQNRLKEHSTWYGLMLVAGSFGLKLSLEQQQAIIYLGMAMVGAPTTNLVDVLRGLFGKNAVAEAPKAPETEVKQEPIKEVVKDDKEKAITDILDDDAAL